MKFYFICVISLIFFCISLINCSDDIGLQNFTIPKDYKNWRKPYNEPVRYAIPFHGNTIRIAYANDLAYKPKIDKKDKGSTNIEYLNGTIFIKENYSVDKYSNNPEPVITIMVKNTENPQSHNGWLYYIKKPKEDLTMVTSKLCYGCHESANEEHPYFDKNENNDFRDYIFSLTYNASDNTTDEKKPQNDKNDKNDDNEH
jgi:hypothetical protein